MSEPDLHSQLTTALGLYAYRLEKLVRAYYRDHQAKGSGNHCDLCTEAERALASIGPRRLAAPALNAGEGNSCSPKQRRTHKMIVRAPAAVSRCFHQ
jgi:hypothetical protein